VNFILDILGPHHLTFHVNFIPCLDIVYLVLLLQLSRFRIWSTFVLCGFGNLICNNGANKHLLMLDIICFVMLVLKIFNCYF